jgi:hypothetical protein
MYLHARFMELLVCSGEVHWPKKYAIPLESIVAVVHNILEPELGWPKQFGNRI